MKSREAYLQSECVRYFRLRYRKFERLLFAVPNGGSRNVLEAANLKKQGVVSGVSDLILLIPRKGFSSLCIELKQGRNIQTDLQKKWQEAAEQAGNKYELIYCFDEFQKLIDWYLG